MFLYANGCSMTYGYELVDDPVSHECLDHEYRETHAWPGRLHAQMGLAGWQNDSTPGSANDRIVRTTIHWISKHWLAAGRAAADLFVIIGWSGPMRREFYIDGQWRQIIPYHDYESEPVQRLNLAYRDTAWHDYESAIRFVTQLISLQSFLRLHNIPYLFFDAISSIQEYLAHGGEVALDYAAHIDTGRYFHFHDLDGHMANVLGQHFPDWKGRHPSLEGHARWAEILAAHIKENDLLKAAFGDVAGEQQRKQTSFERIRSLARGLIPDRERARKRKQFVYP